MRKRRFDGTPATPTTATTLCPPGRSPKPPLPWTAPPKDHQFSAEELVCYRAGTGAREQAEGGRRGSLRRRVGEEGQANVLGGYWSPSAGRKKMMKGERGPRVREGESGDGAGERACVGGNGPAFFGQGGRDCVVWRGPFCPCSYFKDCR